MAQSVEASYDDTFSFGIAFWNDTEEELHLSIVAVDENGFNYFFSNLKRIYLINCLMDAVIMHSFFHCVSHIFLCNLDCHETR